MASRRVKTARRRLRSYKSTSPRGYAQDVRKAAMRQLDSNNKAQFDRWLRAPNRFDLKPIGKTVFDTPKPQLKCPRGDAAIDATVKGLLREWLADIKSGGTNNSVTLGGLKRVLKALDKEKPLDRNSVLVDAGSGAGIPLIYAALKYGVHGIGLEYDPELVDIARRFAKQACVADRVKFEVKDLTTLEPSWFGKRRATHLYTYDGVFLPTAFNSMFDAIEPNHLYGASVSKFKRYWPESIELLSTVPSVALAGGKSSFNFGIWVNRPSRQ